MAPVHGEEENRGSSERVAPSCILALEMDAEGTDRVTDGHDFGHEIRRLLRRVFNARRELQDLLGEVKRCADGAENRSRLCHLATLAAPKRLVEKERTGRKCGIRPGMLQKGVQLNATLHQLAQRPGRHPASAAGFSQTVDVRTSNTTRP